MDIDEKSEVSVRENMLIDIIKELKEELIRSRIEKDALVESLRSNQDCRADHISSLQEKDKHISALTAQLERQGEQLSDIQNKMSVLLSSNKDLSLSLKDKDKENKALRKDVKTLTKQMSVLLKQLKDKDDEINNLRKERYGRSSQRGVKSNRTASRDRQEEKDSFNGNSSSLTSEGESTSETVKDTPKVVKGYGKEKERRVRPSKYDKRPAAEIVYHYCDKSQIPSDYKIIGNSYMVTERTLVSFARDHMIECYDVIRPDGSSMQFYAPLDENDTYLPKVNLVKGTRAYPELVSEVVVDKFQYHLPYTRIQDKFRDMSAYYSAQGLANFATAAYNQTSVIQAELKKLLLVSGSVLYIDETRIRVEKIVDGKKVLVIQYMWVIVNRDANITYFLYDEGSRGRKVIKDFLGDFKGTIVTDAYSAYKCYNDGSLGIKHVGCLAHIRARFKKAQTSDSHATWFLEQIGSLYKIERDNRLLKRTAQEIVDYRQIYGIPIFKSMIQRAVRYRSKAGDTMSTLMSDAITYFINCYNQVVRYADDARCDIDNNQAERSIRPLTLGRKNFIKFGSSKSAEMGAFFYSLVETCKQNGLRAKDYITKTLYSLLEGRRDYSNLVPVAMPS